MWANFFLGFEICYITERVYYVLCMQIVNIKDLIETIFINGKRSIKTRQGKTKTQNLHYFKMYNKFDYLKECCRWIGGGVLFFCCVGTRKFENFMSL